MWQKSEDVPGTEPGDGSEESCPPRWRFALRAGKPREISAARPRRAFRPGAAAVAADDTSSVRTSAVEEQVAAPARSRRASMWELRATISGRTATLLGLAGALGFFVLWELGHYLTPEDSRRFLPSPQHVLGALWTLLAEKDFIFDIAKSCYRIFVSFFAACVVAVPLGITMGCFSEAPRTPQPDHICLSLPPRRLVHPLAPGVSLARRTLRRWLCSCLASSSSLIALILDNTKAVQQELIEAALTMGASRRRVVMDVVVSCGGPLGGRLDAQHDCSGMDLPGDRRNRGCLGRNWRRHDAGRPLSQGRHHHGRHPHYWRTRRPHRSALPGGPRHAMRSRGTGSGRTEQRR